MKTFVVLFIIAASLPADAQRVKENVRQKVEIAEELLVAPSTEEVVVEDAKDQKKEPKKNDDAKRK